MTLLVSFAMLVQPFVAMAAPVGNPFLRGVRDPTHLAVLHEANLARDPSGKTMLDPAQCRSNGSCASPIHYLQALQANDPGANLRSVADLPRYFRSLVEQDAPDGPYFMACLKRTNGVYTAVNNCLSRRFKPGEKAWVNPATGKPVLAENCTNPVGQPDRPAPAPAPCYIIPFDYRGQRDVAWDEGRARVKGHLTLTEEEFKRLQADVCFFVSDEDGVRKPGPIECEFVCPPGSGWPPEQLAAAVGIPGHKPPVSFEFALRDGEGHLSLPLWVLERINISVYCVDTIQYPIRVPGYRGWKAMTRLDTVVHTEMVRTSSAHRLDRTLAGAVSY